MHYATRQYAFEARHQIKKTKLTDKANYDIYGNEVYPHGHNYILRTTISGSKDPESDMIVDLGDLDFIVNKHLVDVWDHKNLCDFVVLPTHENLTLKAWDILRKNIPLLTSIRLYESSEIWSDYFGNRESILYITYCYEFSAARRLFYENLDAKPNKGMFGKKTNIHGHNFRIEITFRSTPDSTGLVIPRPELDQIFSSFDKRFDHQYLNDIPVFEDLLPTSENILFVLWGIVLDYSRANSYFHTDTMERVDDEKSNAELAKAVRTMKLYKMTLIEDSSFSYHYYGQNKEENRSAAEEL